jgi:hypothetical protein
MNVGRAFVGGCFVRLGGGGYVTGGGGYVGVLLFARRPNSAYRHLISYVDTQGLCGVVAGYVCGWPLGAVCYAGY